MKQNNTLKILRRIASILAFLFATPFLLIALWGVACDLNTSSSSSWFGVGFAIAGITFFIALVAGAAGWFLWPRAPKTPQAAIEPVQNDLAKAENTPQKTSHDPQNR